jgi:hypothetical protein
MNQLETVMTTVSVGSEGGSGSQRKLSRLVRRAGILNGNGEDAWKFGTPKKETAGLFYLEISSNWVGSQRRAAMGLAGPLFPTY